MPDARVWAYHADTPAGRIFASPDDVPSGWVDSPAKIGARDAVKDAPKPEPEQPEPADDEPEEAVEETDGDGLDDMSKDELVDLAEERGVEVDKRWGNKKLIEALRGDSA